MGRKNAMVGNIGEDAGVEFLKRKGYRMLARNVRTPCGEIDAVARERNTTVFIEIKSRTSCSFGPPYLAVTRIKQLHIIKSALCYLKKRGLTDTPWRIDVVSVRLNGLWEVENIEHIENAVEDMV